MPNEDIIRRIKFRELNLSDPFFDSLRSAYCEFGDWFQKKAEEEAYVMQDAAGLIHAFVYLKVENGPVTDITPVLNTSQCLKVGTFKIEGHGTQLGERFVKKVFDHALDKGIKHIYVTVFPEYESLITILQRYGFAEYGEKQTCNGIEKVFLKDFNTITQNILQDYPVIDTRGRKKWMLSIYPEWHTQLFPDSILQTEETSIVEDLSHTNSIHKVYIAWMAGMDGISPGDCITIYRTREEGKSGWFSSVATSLCVVEDVHPRSAFTNADGFKKYCRRNSVFTERKLSALYSRRCANEMHVVRMTYNIAFPKRPNRKRLVEEAGLDAGAYWGFFQIPDLAFQRILHMGEVDAGTVIY